jgi:hypothetical protein
VAIIIRTKGFATSTGGHEDQELAYAYCTDESGYCLSLAWFPGDELAEVMVIDQAYGQNTRTKAIRMPHVYFRVA